MWSGVSSVKERKVFLFLPPVAIFAVVKSIGFFVVIVCGSSNETIMAFSGTKRYVPVRFIGSGSMGEVYEVEDRSIGGRAALKLLSGVTGDCVARFKNQFRRICDIHHDNIVQLYEMGSEGGRWFLTMELVDGPNLIEYLSLGADTVPDRDLAVTRKHGCDHVRVRNAFKQLAIGLMALHRHGLIHRDIKPENVLVTSAGRVVILDFGLVDAIADATSSLDVPDGIAGTAHYMAPETASGRRVSEAVDWYGVGVLLYEVLTGALPFDGPVLDLLLKKQSERPVRPEVINPLCNRELAELAMRLLEPDPDLRAGGQEVLDSLGERAAGYRTGSWTRQSERMQDLFVGRSEEIQQMGRVLERACESGPMVLLIEGSSGIGKTRLMEQFLRAVSHGSLGRRGLVFRGRCYERESMGFKAFDAVVDRVSSHLAHMSGQELSFLVPENIWYLVSIFPVLNRIRIINELRYHRPDGGDPTVARQRAFDSFATLLARLSRQQPLVLGIDDIQWADIDSMDLLDALITEGGDDLVEQGKVLVLATVRPNVMSRRVAEHLARLDGLGRVERIRLAPLPRRDGEHLVAHLLTASGLAGSSRQMSWVETIVDESSGNPFLIGEMVQFLRLRAESGAIEGDQRMDFHEVVARRIEDLPEMSRRIFSYVAVAEQPIAQQLLSDAMGTSKQTNEWRRSMARLDAFRLVRFQGFKGDDIVECYHDRGRQAVLKMLGKDVIRAIHADLARAMERNRSMDPQTLASHWLAAGAPDLAKDYLLRAGRESARKLAFGRASDLFATAIQLEDDPEKRHVLLMDLGHNLVNEGRLAEAIDRFDQAAASSDPNLKLRALYEAASNRLKAGYIGQGLASLRPILVELGLKMPETGAGALSAIAWRRLKLKMRGRDFLVRDRTDVSESDLTKLDVLWSLASSMSLVDPMLAAFFHSELWLEALRVGLPEYVAVALVIEGGTKAAMSGRGIAEGRRLITRAESLIPGEKDPRIEGRFLLARGMIEHFAGEWEVCEKLMWKALDLFRTRAYGTGWEVSAALSFLAWAMMRQGRVRDASKMVHREMARATGRRERLFRANVQTSLALIWLVEDRVEEIERLIDDAVITWPRDRIQIQHVYALYGKTDLLLYKGRPGAAWEILVEQIPIVKRSALWRIETTRHELLRGRARVALSLAAVCESPGGRAGYLREAASAIRGLRREKLSYMDAYAKHLDALRFWILGRDRDTTRAKLTGAVGMLEAANLGLYALAARRSLARISGDGEALRDVDMKLRDMGVVRPERIEAVLSPGVVTDDHPDSEPGG